MFALYFKAGGGAGGAVGTQTKFFGSGHFIELPDQQ